MAVANPPRRRQEAVDVDGQEGGNGIGQKECLAPSPKAWGQMGQGIQNGTACIQECLERFRRDVLTGAVAPDGTTGDGLDPDQLLCQVLGGGVGAETGTARFSNLYCCDLMACGIWFNSTAEANRYGQDRKFALASPSALCCSTRGVHFCLLTRLAHSERTQDRPGLPKVMPLLCASRFGQN
jgi:hypothetical protein